MYIPWRSFTTHNFRTLYQGVLLSLPPSWVPIRVYGSSQNCSSNIAGNFSAGTRGKCVYHL